MVVGLSVFRQYGRDKAFDSTCREDNRQPVVINTIRCDSVCFAFAFCYPTRGEVDFRSIHPQSTANISADIWMVLVPLHCEDVFLRNPNDETKFYIE